MGYRDDEQARDTLKAALTGLGIALLFLLAIGTVAYMLAVR